MILLKSIEKLMKLPETEVDYFRKLLEDSLKGIMTYSVLVSSLELGVFDALKVPKGIDSLSKELRCDEKLLLLLSKVLCKLGLLSEADGKFVNTKLRRGTAHERLLLFPESLLENIRETVNLWLNLTKILREGGIVRKPEKFFAERRSTLSRKIRYLESFRRQLK